VGKLRLRFGAGRANSDDELTFRKEYSDRNTIRLRVFGLFYCPGMAEKREHTSQFEGELENPNPGDFAANLRTATKASPTGKVHSVTMRKSQPPVIVSIATIPSRIGSMRPTLVPIPFRTSF
jgi:hypothetical protein